MKGKELLDKLIYLERQDPDRFREVNACLSLRCPRAGWPVLPQLMRCWQ